ncbi:hypothetical protein NM688_g6608 [Phlebia brevispora]|uniref:Uncharacterized protein n=1 Tax=Phlebia brevispora TaxID=194682 RepID=A0ACC1SE89_9APHY|nr:hypothetical protein NM688_g6608 [Phlebia brevispora]
MHSILMRQKPPMRKRCGALNNKSLVLRSTARSPAIGSRTWASVENKSVSTKLTSSVALETLWRDVSSPAAPANTREVVPRRRATCRVNLLIPLLSLSLVMNISAYPTYLLYSNPNSSPSTSSWLSSTTSVTSTEDLEDQPASPPFSDPHKASIFGRLAPGASTPPPPTSPSMKNRGDASATSTPKKAVNRVNATLPLPRRRVRVHPALLLPLPSPISELNSDPCTSPFEPAYASPPSYRTVAHPFDHHLHFVHPPPAFDDVPLFLNPPSGGFVMDLSPQESIAGDIPDIPDMDEFEVVPLGSAPGFISRNTHEQDGLPGAIHGGVLGLQTMPGTRLVDVHTPPSFSSALRTDTTFSQRLRSLAPPPLYIPPAHSFTDSGVALESRTPPPFENPVTTLLYPAQTPT